jgi:hypothetical protein
MGITSRNVTLLVGLACAALGEVTPPFRTTLATRPQADSRSLDYRWVYCSYNLQVDENVDRLEQLLTRAAKSGYNGVLLADYKFNILDRVPERYFANASRVRQKAAQLKLDIIPAVMPIGYSEGLLSHDPNLAEGLPVRDQLLVVRGKAARVAPDPKVQLEGGAFENARDHKFVGWDYQDLPGRASFLDSTQKHAGQSSLQMRQIREAEGRPSNCRVTKKIAVSPYRQYHLSAWIKTSGFREHASVRLFAIGADGVVLSHSNLDVKESQDWTQHHVMLNSLGNQQITVYCGVWGGTDGTLWLDDLKIEETAFVNLLRRPGCPFAVSRQDGSILREGIDFVQLADSRMGVTPWPGGFDVYHEPPVLQLTDAAQIKDGDQLRVAYYHAVTIYDNQVTCCLSEPKVFDIASRQVASVQKLLEPRGFMLSHDEIRVANWCASCTGSTPRPAGALLADNVRRCIEITRRASPRSEVFVWSDMFDPTHNALDKYYLVNGTLAQSWEGLPSDIVIVNWNHGAAAKSLPFFAGRGHRQILAGYYDSAPDAIGKWLQTAGTNSNVAGVMYTTWRDKYDDLEAFARHAWGKP